MSKKVSSFDFLNKFDPLLFQLGALAESYPESDPHASLIRLRQYGDVLGRLVAQKFFIYVESEEVYFDLLESLKVKDQIPPDIIGGFNQLRISGNNALHDFQGHRNDVKKNIRIAIKLGHWFVSISDNQGKINSLEKSLAPDLKNKLNKIITKIQPEEKIQKVSNDFSGQDLSEKNFSGKNLVGFDFSGANLYKASFQNANLKNTIFDGADIRGADFIGSKSLQSYQLEHALIDSHTKLPDNLIGRIKIQER